MAELLDIVNENDEVIGQVERDDANKARHIFRMIFIGFYTPNKDIIRQVERDDANKARHIFRMIFIGFYTPNKDIILQIRSMAKKSYPGKLTSTVSGHVESGMSYDETVIKEGYEETGVEIDATKLESIGTFSSDAMRAVYAYPYDGAVEDLKIEENEGAGFVAFSVDNLQSEIRNNPGTFTPFLLGEAGTALIDHIKNK